MNQLHNLVLEYYMSHLEALGSKRLHFLSRMYLWTLDESYLLKLKALPETGFFETESLFIAHIRQRVARPSKLHTKNFSDLREPLFKKYDPLHTLSSIFTDIRNARVLFGHDYTHVLSLFYSDLEIETLLNSLLRTPQDLLILSTHAINPLFHYFHFVKKDPHAFDIELLVDSVKPCVDESNPDHILLWIYLLTHIIIGETQFYSQKISTDRLHIHTRLIHMLEDTIESQFNNIHLDAKCEFLVCCRIVQYASHLYERIMNECTKSVSEVGTFIIDRLNSQPQFKYISFESSEHRNVLFLMAQTPWALLLKS